MAREIVEQGIRHRYKDMDLSEIGEIQLHYLDKIIQFPFALPTADEDKLKDKLLKPELERLKMHDFMDLIHDTLGNNPRTLKRFLNVIDFTCHLAKKKLQKPPNSKLLIKISLISYLFPELYKIIETSPVRLVQLQDIVRKHAENRSDADPEKVLPLSEEVKTLSIGRWLEGKSLEQLTAILKVREQDANADKGFGDEATVKQYVRLVATSVQEERPGIQGKPSPFLGRGALTEEMRRRMKPIQSGEFLMGDEQTGQRRVTLSRDFYVDCYPVTQSLYAKVMGDNPSYFKGEDRPVETVSWFDAVQFCNRLSQQCDREPCYDIQGESVIRDEGKNGFRLLTEAEWEYACRAGTEGDIYGTNLDAIAWYDRNSGGQTHGVGEKTPNAFGLYDMLGNVWEWCEDLYGKYPKTDETDPMGMINGPFRVLRGGSWYGIAGRCRSACRGGNHPGYRGSGAGFRLAAGQV